MGLDAGDVAGGVDAGRFLRRIDHARAAALSRPGARLSVGGGEGVRLFPQRALRVRLQMFGLQANQSKNKLGAIT